MRSISEGRRRLTQCGMAALTGHAPYLKTFGQMPVLSTTFRGLAIVLQREKSPREARVLQVHRRRSRRWSREDHRRRRAPDGAAGGAEVIEVATRVGQAAVDRRHADRSARDARSRSRDRDRCAADPDRVRPLRASGVSGHRGVRRSRGRLAAHDRPRAVQKVAAETRRRRATRVRQLAAQARLAPYAHRATDVVMTYQRGLLPLSSLGAANSAITARAGQLRTPPARRGLPAPRQPARGLARRDDRRAVRPARRARLQARRRSVGHARADPREARRSDVRAAEPDGARGRAAQRSLLRRGDLGVHRVSVGARRLGAARPACSPRTAGSSRRPDAAQRSDQRFVRGGDLGEPALERAALGSRSASGCRSGCSSRASRRYARLIVSRSASSSMPSSAARGVAARIDRRASARCARRRRPRHRARRPRAGSE